MVPEYVIVTVRTEAGALLGDFQLPTGVPAGRIAARLADGLKKQTFGRLGDWEEPELCWKGFPLANEKSFADHGIWDGNVITIREGKA